MIESAPAPRRPFGWLRLVGTAVSLSLLVWMLSRQDWRTIRELAAGIPVTILALSLGMDFASLGFNSLRWWILMYVQRIRVSYGLAFRLSASGLFASNFLPGTIGGDVLRIGGVVPRSPDAVVGVASVVVDRGIGVTTMLFVLPLSLTTFGSHLAPLLRGTAASAVWPASMGQVLSRAGRKLLEVLRPWLRRPQSLLGSLAASMAGVACYLTGLWLIARGLDMDVSLLDVGAVTGITYFLSQLPISINAFGLREAAMIALYTELGQAPEQAAALALITRALVMLATVPGAIWLPGLLATVRTRPVEEKR